MKNIKSMSCIFLEHTYTSHFMITPFKIKVLDFGERWRLKKKEE